jgi:hypothetical protein
MIIEAVSNFVFETSNTNHTNKKTNLSNFINLNWYNSLKNSSQFVLKLSHTELLLSTINYKLINSLIK